MNILTQPNETIIEDDTTELTMLGSGYAGSTLLPANTFVKNKVLKIVSFGTISTKSGTVGNLTLRLKIGATTILTKVLSSLPSLLAEVPCELHFTLAQKDDGASGNCIASGEFKYQVSGVYLSVPIAPVGTTNGNTTDKNVNATAQWATADAGNKLTVSFLSAKVEQVP